MKMEKARWIRITRFTLNLHPVISNHMSLTVDIVHAFLHLILPLLTRQHH